MKLLFLLSIFVSLSSIVLSVAQQDYTDCDCLVVTVLTHGVESNYLHARDVLYRVGELWQPFTPDRCPTLAGKPKLFFIQVHYCIYYYYYYDSVGNLNEVRRPSCS